MLLYYPVLVLPVSRHSHQLFCYTSRANRVLQQLRPRAMAMQTDAIVPAHARRTERDRRMQARVLIMHRPEIVLSVYALVVFVLDA